MPQIVSASEYDRAATGASTRLMLLSAALWAVGVVFIRYAAPLGVFAPGWGAALLPATVPLAWLTVDLAVRVAGPAAPLPSVAALVSMPALLLDGLAITFAPGLYGPVGVPLHIVGAWLLWFVGVSLAVALWKQTRQNRGRA